MIAHSAIPPEPAADEYAAIKNVYDNYRTAVMNAKYYGAKLHKFTTLNTIFEVALAFGTGGTALSALPLWKTNWGVGVWLVLASISAVLGIVKPILNLGKKIERYSNLFSTYNGTANAMRGLVEDIQAYKRIRPEVFNSYGTLADKLREVAANDDPVPTQKVLQEAYAAVKREIPAGSLWWPAKGVQLAS